MAELPQQITLIDPNAAPVFTSQSLKGTFSNFGNSFDDSESNSRLMKIGAWLIGLTLVVLLVYWAIVAIGRYRNKPQRPPDEVPPLPFQPSPNSGGTAQQGNTPTAVNPDVVKVAKKYNEYLNSSEWYHFLTPSIPKGMCAAFCASVSATLKRDDAYVRALGLEYQTIDAAKVKLSNALYLKKCDCATDVQKLANRLQPMGL